MDTLKIGITGPHGSGKTTLLNDLKDQGLDISFLPEITRSIKDKGFDINESGSIDTQLLIFATHIQNLLLNKRFIVDRCMLDGLLYTIYLNEINQVPDWVVEFAKKTCDTYLPKYDYIFYIPVEFALEDDGTRSQNSAFYKRIKELFSEYVSFYKKQSGSNIITITGTREERVNKVLEVIHA